MNEFAKISLRQPIWLALLIFASQHSNPSQNTAPYRFALKFDIKFVNLSRRDPHLKNVNLKTSGAVAPDKTAHSAATSHVQWG